MTEDYAQYGRDALAGTTGGWVRWSDEDYGSSLAVVVAGEIGDPLAESNVHAAGVILEQWYGTDVDTFTVGRSGRSWLRGLAVRVFGEDGEVTDAWRTAVDEVIIPLEGYPLLDEDDYSERRHAVTWDSLVLDYGDAADLVAEALGTCGNWSLEEYVGDHDEVVTLVEEYLRLGLHKGDVVLDGLEHYVQQRKNDLDIPILAGLLAEAGA